MALLEINKAAHAKALRKQQCNGAPSAFGDFFVAFFQKAILFLLFGAFVFQEIKAPSLLRAVKWMNTMLRVFTDTHVV